MELTSREQQAYDAGVRRERERCARIAEESAQRNATMSTKTPTAYKAALDIVAAIRNQET